MPPNPRNVENILTLSEDYHDEKVQLYIYSNSAIEIVRGDIDLGESVWLDNLEKRELLSALEDHVDE